MLVIYLILFCLTTYFIRIKDPNYRNVLSPSLFLVVSMCIYSIFGSLYIARNTSNDLFQSQFWLIQISSILGVFFALNICKFKRAITIKKSQPSRLTKILFVFISIVHLILYVNKYGGLNEILSSGYKLVYEMEENDIFVFSILGFLSAFSIRFNMNLMVFVSSVIFLLISIALGTRGFALAFMSIPILSYYINRKRLDYKFILFSFPLLVFFLVAGYIRNIGFGNLETLSDFDYSFIYSLIIENSEFNTTGLVILTGLKNPQWYDNNFFEYFFGILSSIIPKSLWPGRPEAISNTFSNKFAPLGEGIGFSVGYEGYVLFGLIGPFIFFFLIQYFLQKAYPSRTFIINSLLNISPLLIIWVNRIDFQTIFKVSLVYILFSLIWYNVAKLIEKFN